MSSLLQHYIRLRSISVVPKPHCYCYVSVQYGGGGAYWRVGSFL